MRTPFPSRQDIRRGCGVAAATVGGACLVVIPMGMACVGIESARVAPEGEIAAYETAGPDPVIASAQRSPSTIEDASLMAFSVTNLLDGAILTARDEVITLHVPALAADEAPSLVVDSVSRPDEDGRLVVHASGAVEGNPGAGARSALGLRCFLGRLAPGREYLVEFIVQPPSTRWWTPPPRRCGVLMFRTALVSLGTRPGRLVVGRSGVPNHY